VKSNGIVSVDAGRFAGAPPVVSPVALPPLVALLPSVAPPPPVNFDHAADMFEVDPRPIALDSQKRLERFGPLGIGGELLHQRQRIGGRFNMVPLQQGALIADLAGDQGAGDPQAGGGIGRLLELPQTQLDVSNAQAMRDSVEPATLGEVRDRHFLLA
jgi:hypothetical protein